MFKTLFHKKPDSFNREGLIIKTAFIVGGREYLEIDNVYNLPTHRGQQAAHVYEELKMKCDVEFLKAHVTACDNLFKGKKIALEEINKLKQLNDQLKERLYHIIDTDLVYKLASVVFFDKTESPFKYDPLYARKKIEFWKKHSTVDAFFLQEPLVRLAPFLKLQEVNFQTYSDTIRKFNQVQWDVVFQILSEKQRKDFSEVRDFYAGATLVNSEN